MRVVSRGRHFKFAARFGNQGCNCGGFGLVDAECPEFFSILFDRVQTKDIEGISMLIVDNLVYLFAAHRIRHEITCF